MPKINFKKGRRYRLEVLRAGAHKSTVYRVNYLGENALFHEGHDFDGRPDFGTMTVHEDAIVKARDIGPAIYKRR